MNSPQPVWPVAVVSSLIAVEQNDEPCWRVRRYLGSMLSLDFGGRTQIATRRGSIEVGTSTLGIRDCFWTVRGPELQTIDSETIDDGLARKIDLALRRAALTGCATTGDSLSLAFSNGVRFEIDLTNRWESEDDILELRLRGGAVLMLSPDGAFSLDEAASLRAPERLSA